MNSYTKPDPHVGIIILNWNDFETTADCLDSLSNVSYNNFTTYVIDNGSSDDSYKKLVKSYDRPIFHKKDSNTGFASGCNTGISLALKDGCEYVLLLNNDITVQADFLDQLVITAESGDDVAAVGGIIKHYGNDGIWFSGGEIVPELAKTKRNTEIPSTETYETDWIISALMIISAEFIEEYGLLNDDYFFGSEDQDLCHYASKAGWKLLINPKSIVTHDVHSTAGSSNGFQMYHNSYNRLYFASNHLNTRQKLVFYPYFFFNRLALLLYFTGRLQFEIVIGLMVGLLDYTFGNQRPATEYL